VEVSAIPDSLPPNEVPPVVPDLPTVTQCAAADPAGGLPAIPGYEMLGRLGRGGMGVVYKARQVSLNRVVALKMILAGAHADPEAVARFRAEARAVAALQHPNIVQIFEVGEHGGLPFLALEYVEGGSLAQAVGGAPLPAATAARLVAALAAATHYAHSRHVVHRDLKPANILLQRSEVRGQKSEAGSQPDQVSSDRCPLTSDLWPKITDFGLAKRLDGPAAATRTGAILGTPGYMAPEQAGNAGEVGPATDVHALGAILYELLTGRPPFLGATLEAVLEQVRSHDPVPPRRLAPGLPRDLEIICLKCLRKEPHRRYAGAGALADDLGRFLEGRPVLARPVSTWERAAKWARRRPAVAALIGLVLVVGLAGAAIGGWLWHEAVIARGVSETRGEELANALEKVRSEKARADTEAKQVKAQLYFQTVALAYRHWLDKEVEQADELLRRCPPEFRRWEWHHLKRLCHGEFLALDGSVVVGSSANVALSPDGTLVAAPSTLVAAPTLDKGVLVWDAVTGRERAGLLQNTSPAAAVAFSPDGNRLAAAGEGEGGREVRVWEVATGQLLFILPEHSGRTSAVAFSLDGARLAAASVDGTVKVWDAAGRLTHSLHADTAGLGLAFSPDGNRIVTDSRGRAATLWDLATGKCLRRFEGHGGAVQAVAVAPGGGAFPPNGFYLATASLDGTVKVWDAESGKELRTMPAHAGGACAVAFGAGGHRLASAGRDNVLKLWDPVTGKELFTLLGHTSWVTAVALSADGKRLASAARAPIGREVFGATADQLPYHAGEFKVWDPAERPPARRRRESCPGAVAGLRFSGDGHTLVAIGGSGTKALAWDVAGDATAGELAGPAGLKAVLAVHPGGRRLAVRAADGALTVWDPRAGRELVTFPEDAKSLTGDGAAFSPDGERLAWLCRDGRIKVCDVSGTAPPLVLGPLLTEGTWSTWSKTDLIMAFSADGRRLATANSGDPFALQANDSGTVTIWDAVRGTRLAGLKHSLRFVTNVNFSPDGTRLAVATRHPRDKGTDRVEVWDVANERVLHSLAGAGPGVAFSPDGERLVTAGAGVIKVWDVETGWEILTLRDPAWCGNEVAFSPDGSRLAVDVHGGLDILEGAP
jgi:WD40 repeat protein